MPIVFGWKVDDNRSWSEQNLPSILTVVLDEPDHYDSDRHNPGTYPELQSDTGSHHAHAVDRVDQRINLRVKHISVSEPNHCNQERCFE